MRKSLIAIAAAATLVLGSLAAPQPAQARNRGGAVAAGIIGGLAAGALIGSAAARGSYYGPGYYYGPAPVYYYRPHCWWQRERWWNGWRWHWRRVRVCE